MLKYAQFQREELAHSSINLETSAMSDNEQVRIAIDLDGGDGGHRVTTKGIERAIRLGYVRPKEIIALGSDNAVSFAQRRLKDTLACVPCSETVAMTDEPRDARRKKESSMAEGLKGVGNGEFQAFVSCGNTGALVLMANRYLGRLSSKSAKTTPGIAVPLPNLKGPCLLLDAGAMRAAVDAQALSFYALMGTIYAREVWGVERPIVRLLNQGEESFKGNDALRSANSVISRIEGINFCGNIEADRIPLDKVNVVVCSGDSGNLYIKTGEGFRSYQAEKLGWLWQAVSFFNAHHKRADYKEIGGAIILGLDGIVIKAHGKSSPMAIANAIRRAMLETRAGIVPKIKEGLQALP